MHTGGFKEGEKIVREIVKAVFSSEIVCEFISLFFGSSDEGDTS